MKPYDYQIVGAEFLKRRQWALLGDEMGVGKSVQAILATSTISGPKLIVCPAMLRETWREELLKWYDELPTHSIIEVVDKPAKCDWSMMHEDIYYIVSYDGVRKIPEEFKPNAIIFDEVHYIKNVKAIRTKSCHDLVLRTLPTMCACLSGTAIKNNVTEFYSILLLLSYCPQGTNGLKITEKSQYAFSLRFSKPTSRLIGTPDGVREITEFKGIRNIKRLKGYLKGKYLRRKAASVLELPPLVEKEIIIKDRVSGHDKELLQAFNEAQEGKKGDHISSVKMGNAHDKVKFTVDYVVDIIDGGDDESVVVYTDHVDSCKMLYDKLFSRKLEVDLIHGSIPVSKRSLKIKNFQKGKTKVLVCTIGAASEGITLTAARHMVFNDYSWEYVAMAQAIKRIHRISQKRNCIIHYLFSSKLDRFIQHKILDKEKILGEIL